MLAFSPAVCLSVASSPPETSPWQKLGDDSLERAEDMILMDMDPSIVMDSWS